ncbi:hypothetical protein [Uliginosibacterium sediminicola]|uniref:Uncharacterized protein n=1 Tax=Uliginosibacterium sediminicola TaxID=2024550 RepID=A0ABU9YW31_9RHOO
MNTNRTPEFRAQCIALLTEWQGVIEELNAQHAVLRKALLVQLECPVIAAANTLVSSYTQAVSVIVGCDVADDWLEWYALENDFGRKGFEAGYDGKLRPIRTLQDLLDLIWRCNA